MYIYKNSAIIKHIKHIFMNMDKTRYTLHHDKYRQPPNRIIEAFGRVYLHSQSVQLQVRRLQHSPVQTQIAALFYL